ncbi:MAG: hypothetical protein CMG64_01715 [Candidatus Marinimicrobia bacterium]|nr:hypothetical protein [Candidatus Neomarinimicrobiota bacterium]|tara:strand:- start:140 stop:1942 length:1803 start_codon:yes stop_codon:yes gene_type:complete
MLNFNYKKIIYILFVILNIAYVHPNCNYEIGDSNNDNYLNVVDVIAIVNIIINDSSYDSNFDLNFDLVINVEDVIIVVNRIVDENPQKINLININFDFNNLLVSWNKSNDYGFESYSLFYSNLILDEALEIYSTDDVLDTLITINDFDLKEQNWFFLIVEDFLGCETYSDQLYYELPYKHYSLDSNGNILETDISINDFNSANDCQACHQNQFNEWSNSMHAYTMNSPLFFSYMNQTIENHPNTGGKFCIQCHSPAAFLSDYSLGEYQTFEEFQNDNNLPQIIKEGVSCDICHTATGLSQTVMTNQNGAANATYKLYPGENIKFGSIENPDSNSYHESYYLPTYSLSEMCLPCHDLVVNDVEAEITFTEWDRIPGFSMFGGIPCQSCHMPVKQDGSHDHSFIGVDLDLNIPYSQNPEYPKIVDLLSNSVEMEFGIWGVDLLDTISINDTLNVPLLIESITAHSIPSGTSFNRDVWIELTIENNQDIIYSSGLLENDSDLLNYNDNDLVFFKSFLLDELGDTTRSVIDSHDIINNSLAAYSQRFAQYSFIVDENYSGTLEVKARMLFRVFDPEFILEHHHQFLNNIPIIEMESISKTVVIN